MNNTKEKATASVKGYKIDYRSNAVYVNYKFYAEAQRDFHSEEAKLLREIQSAFPTMSIVVKSGRNITTPRSNKRLTYENMKKYISVYENADELLKTFEIVKTASAVVKSPYKYVRDWFEAQFPDYQAVPDTGDVKSKVIIISAPDTAKYKCKEKMAS